MEVPTPFGSTKPFETREDKNIVKAGRRNFLKWIDVGGAGLTALHMRRTKGDRSALSSAALRLAIIAVVCLSIQQCTIADVTWVGDFSTMNLHQYNTIQCGANANSGGSCPGRVRAGRTTKTPTDLVSDPCPEPDQYGCRFRLVSPPNPEQWMDGYALRVTVADGDWYDRRWGTSGFRNELVGVKEDEGRKTTYTQGDDRYYSWYSFIPEDFPDALAANPSWHLIVQFHEDGNCGANGPPLQIGMSKLSRPGMVIPYQFSMFNKQVYDTKTDVTPLWLQGTALEKGVWHSFVLHVYWATTPCGGDKPAACDPKDPDGGLIELWFNGEYVWPGAGSSPAAITMYRWPPMPLCENDRPRYPEVANQFMPVYLKTGLYRDRRITVPETVYHYALIAGKTFEDVGATCQREAEK